MRDNPPISSTASQTETIPVSNNLAHAVRSRIFWLFKGAK